MVHGRQGGIRRAPRLSIQLEGSVTGRSPRPVKVVDVSFTGCLVQCDARLDPGAILDLELQLGSEPLALKVRVANSFLDGTSPEASRFLAGLEFISLPAREATRLRRFLEEERRRRGREDTTPH
jgi:PilZ domain-containing protein